MTRTPAHRPRHAALLLALLLISGCRRPVTMREASWLTMGTFASLSLPCAREQQLQAASVITKDTFAAVNTALTIYTDTSELAALNRAPAGQRVPLSPLALDCLRLARHYAQLSEGAFDYTVAPLVKLWGFNNGTPPSKLPTAAERNRLLTRVGYDRLRLFTDGAAWTTDAMQADLGGVAKGFAVDAAYDRLVAAGTHDELMAGSAEYRRLVNAGAPG